MHELQTQLEQIFDCSILFMSVQDKGGAMAIPAGFQLGRLMTHAVPPSCVVKVKLADRKHFTRKPEERLSLLHVLGRVTPHAAVQTVLSEREVAETIPVYTVEFVVYDCAGFEKDVINYCWNNFSDKFNNDLDKVLDDRDQEG